MTGVRFRARWWHWLLASLAILALTPPTIALALRERGFHRLDAEIARLRDRGVPTTIADLIARAPAVDDDRQALWDAATARLQAAKVDNLTLDDASFADVAAGKAYPPKLLQRFEALGPAMHDLRRALRDGPVVATGFAHMRQRLAGDPDVTTCAAMPVANLLSMRLAAQWLAIDALRGDDADGALADPDRLQAALARPAVTIDAMVMIVVADVRDEAYLRALVLRRLAEARLAAWEAEPATQLRVLAEAFDGERILYTQKMVDFERQRGASLSTGNRLSLGSIGLGTRLDWFVFSGDGGAALVAYDASMTDRWRGGRGSAPMRPDRVRGIVQWVEADAVECGRSAWEACARHRVARIAAALHAGRDLPEDEVAFVGRFPTAAGGGDDAALRYERLGGSRFRLSIDPATPVPDFADPKRPAAKAKVGVPATLVGNPPRAAPLVNGRAWLEADVAPDPTP